MNVALATVAIGSGALSVMLVLRVLPMRLAPSG